MSGRADINACLESRCVVEIDRQGNKLEAKIRQKDHPLSRSFMRSVAASFKGTYQSKLANWTVIPVATAVFMAVAFPMNSYADLYDRALLAPRIIKTGKLTFLDIRHRYIGLVTKNETIRVACDMYNHSSRRCLPAAFAVPTDASVEYFNYHGRRIILSARDMRSGVALKAGDQLARLKRASRAMAKDTPVRKAELGLAAGLFFAALRHMLHLRRRNRPTPSDQ